MTLPVPWNWPPILQSEPAQGAQFPFAVVDDPDPWDLIPSKWTNPDIALNGWFIYAVSGAPVQLTNDGEVDIRSDPPAGTYRASLKSGQLWVQLQRGITAHIGKAGAMNNKTYRSRVRGLSLGRGSGNSYLAMSYVATGELLNTGAVNSFWIGNNDIHNQSFWFTGSTFHPTIPNNDVDFNYAVMDMDMANYIDVDPAQLITSRAYSAYSGAMGYYSPAGNNVALGVPVTHAGVVIGNNGANWPSIYYLDFIAMQDLYQVP